ncbi:MAG TPA: EAL domain-containing protein [Geminicoccaceae bacterium]|nr:EAL domain-containing protein [Geminicoccaceae bacterium]
MPTLFWLALLLGYLTGVAAAVLFLPGALIEPLYGPLVLMTVIVLAGFGALVQLRHARRRAAETGAPPREEASPDGRRDTAAAAALESDAPVTEIDPAGRASRSDDRWPMVVRLEPPGVMGPSELRQILYAGRVDARLRPLASLAQPHAALYHALPRLRAPDDSCLEPARYCSTAARCGLLGVIDRLLFLRCVGMLRAARAEGREAVVFCTIAADSLTDPGFAAEVEQQLTDDPQLAESLALALDHTVRDGLSVAALARLRGRGVRFCLRRIGPPPVDAAELGRSGFDFVLLEAGRFAVGPETTRAEPALRELQRVFGATGPTLLVARAGFDQAAIELPGEWALTAEDGAFDLVARPSAA